MLLTWRKRLAVESLLWSSDRSDNTIQRRHEEDMGGNSTANSGGFPFLLFQGTKIRLDCYA